MKLDPKGFRWGGRTLKLSSVFYIQVKIKETQRKELWADRTTGLSIRSFKKSYLEEKSNLELQLEWNYGDLDEGITAWEIP
jgi:hypothetical protein